MMKTKDRFILCLLVLVASLLPVAVEANDYNNYQAANDYNAYNGYNNNQDQDEQQAYDNNQNMNQYLYDDAQAVDDNIEYWTSFSIQAKRCVVYKDVDVVVFEVFGHGDQCTSSSSSSHKNNLVGTYYTPVPYYMQGLLKEVDQKMQDRGVDDYVEPEVAQYEFCTAKQVNDEMLYLQLGCADDSTQSIAVNVYSDNTCETRAPNQYGLDDANMDISDIQIPFKKCQSCVNWVNKEDDQIDDQFYEKRQMLAPLCSTAWYYKEKCGQRCQMVGRMDEQEGWNQSDITLLIILGAFGLIVGAVIWRKRIKMSQKHLLMETSFMHAIGLQTPHLAGIFILILLVIGIFALLALKNVVFAMILLIDMVLFGYLMKLTIQSMNGSSKEPILGPDGQVIEKADSDDDSDDGSRESSVRGHANSGTYMLPTLT